jgi:osmoprotectant transport system substrate-binding protein
LLTLLLFWGLGAIAWLARKNSQAGLLLGGGLILLLAGHGTWIIGKQVFAGSSRAVGVVRLGSKNFVEGEILTELVKQMLEAHSDLRVEVLPNLAPNLILKAILNGEIDGYIEYTGHLLTNKEALDMGVPADKSTITAIVREGMLKKHRLVLLETFGLNNTYVLCAPKPFAARHGLRRISDLRRVGDLRIVVDLDFLDRADGWRGLVKTYELDLPPPQQVSPDLRYRSLEKGADIVLAFATDWEIEAFDLAVLEDDRGYFPNYHGAPLMREDVLKLYPEIAEVLNRLRGQIDDRTMRQLNAQVARDRRPEAEVARDFLLQKGLLP